jgi:RNA polymerase sigma-70 factor (ECF subfamily)
VTVTDFELLERFAANRDEEAFSTVARRHAARVRGVCRRVLANEHDAEDALQATFLVLADKGATLEPDASLGGWLSAVAFRQALHTRATRQRHVPACGIVVGETCEPAVAANDPATEAARQEIGAVVREEIATLPEECRAPVVLCYLEGKTNEEAARELNWPSGSMSRRLEKARRLLRAKFVDRGLAVLVMLVGVAVLGSLYRFDRVEPTLCAAAGRVETRSESKDPLRQLLQDAVGQGRDSAVRIARAAIVEASALEARAPAERRAEWQQLAREMGVAARELATRSDTDDVRPASNRLTLACAQCHHSFRDNN